METKDSGPERKAEEVSAEASDPNKPSKETRPPLSDSEEDEEDVKIREEALASGEWCEVEIDEQEELEFVTTKLTAQFPFLRFHPPPAKVAATAAAGETPSTEVKRVMSSGVMVDRKKISKVIDLHGSYVYSAISEHHLAFLKTHGIDVTCKKEAEHPTPIPAPTV